MGGSAGGGVDCGGCVNHDVKIFVHDKAGADGGTGMVFGLRVSVCSSSSSSSMITSDCANSTRDPCTGRRGEYTITLEGSLNVSGTTLSRAIVRDVGEPISSSALQTLVRRPSSEPFINTGLLRAWTSS